MSEGSFFPGRLLVVSHKRHDRLKNGDYFVRGGFSILKNEFAKHFTELRLCVPVFCENRGQKGTSYLENISVCALPAYKNRGEFIVKIPKIITTIWREMGSCDMVYAMCPNDMGILALLIARIKRKPVFISIDTDRAAKIKAESSGFLSTAKAKFVSVFIYGLLKAIGGNIPAFITGDQFLGARKSWHQWVKTTIPTSLIPRKRKSVYREGQVPTIIFVGRLETEKNVALLIEACQRINSLGIRLKLLIVGEGSQCKNLVSIVDQLKVDDVAFLGQLTNAYLIENNFLNADLLVLPSKEERQGKVLLEAMACSVPVIASRAGGIPSVIYDYQNGLLFDSGSSEDLKQKILEILNNPSMRNRLVDCGYKFACENALDKTVEEILGKVFSHYRLQPFDV